MKQIKCPCEECISFAICNSIIRDQQVPDVSQFSLDRNCEQLKEFVGMGLPIPNRELFREYINNARKVFGLEELFPYEKHRDVPM